MNRLLLRNKLHLNQAFNIPFALGPLKEYIREYGLGPGAEEILEGNFDANIDCNIPAVNYWLKHHLHREAAPNTVRVNLILEKHPVAMTIQDESTSLSPS
eukprot:20005-Ditylum_brightwellii.AAC.1